VAVANVPTSRSRSIGERVSNDSAPSPLAVDVVLVMPAELGLRVGDGRLEAGVEFLVVGAQGGVGDLDAWLGIGGHGGPSCQVKVSGTVRSV